MQQERIIEFASLWVDVVNVVVCRYPGMLKA